MVVRRTLIFAILIAIAVPLGFYFSQQGQAEQEQQEQLSNIQVYRVTLGDVRTSVEASGEVESDRVVALSFDTGGRIEDIFIQEGDFVLEGSILAVIENDAEALAYQQAYLNKNRAELTYFDTMNVDEDELEIASENLRAAWTGLGTADSAVTDADMAAMEIQYQELLQTAQEMQTNADQAPGGYFGDYYETLQSLAGEASFNAEIARLQMQSALENEQPGINAAYGGVLQAQANLEQLLAGPNDFTRQRLDLQMGQAVLDVSNARQDYADTFLVAPHNGVVSNLMIEDGSLVIAGNELLRLTDIQTLVATIYVDEIDIGQVEDDMKVIFTADAIPGREFVGTVTKVAPRSSIRDGVVVYEVELTLDDSDSLLRVGMTVDAEIALEEVENTILIPSRFVRRAPNGQSTVIILNEDGTRQERMVITGLRGQQNTEIISGIAPGELVVLDSLNLQTGGGLFGG